MILTEADRRLDQLVQGLELPTSAYQLAKKRYEHLGEWFEREGGALEDHDVHIFVQGSFALGTAIRPVNADEEYDLDLSCKLRSGVARRTHSQAALKEMVRTELEEYRAANQIKDELDEHHRCWRLQYQDKLRFHMDVVPCIPTEPERRRVAASLMEQAGTDESLASLIAADSVWITDDRNDGYDDISTNWNSSNAEGYITWFSSRMEDKPPAGLVVEAKVDEIPLYERKNTLQRVIQLLKRHRDILFQDSPDSKPISIIISTLAANAYTPGSSLATALADVLNALIEFCDSDSSEVPNPTNPKENFADRWSLAACVPLELKKNFHRWVHQAASDFRKLTDTRDRSSLIETATSRLGVSASIAEAASSGIRVSESAPVRHTQIREGAPQPWSGNA